MDLNLNMASQRSYQRSETVTQRTVWRPQAETDDNQAQSTTSGNPSASIRLAYQQSLQQFSESHSLSQEHTTQSASNASISELDDLSQDPELMKTKNLLEAMFGVTFTLYKSDRPESDHPPQANNLERITNLEDTEERVDINGQPLEQVNQQFHDIKEAETTRFQANGEVVLQDGRRFDIEFSLDMARTKEESFYGEMIITGQQVDPLTINLNGNMAQLSQNKVQFDINNDGEMDNVHYASGDSAFLAIDKNGNGRIDDGGELFGPQSGSGFTDLSHYDENQDGVIDKDDSIFEKLVLTQRDEAGNENLISLKEVGIEAFLLASQDTQFSLFNSNGERAGIIQETGLYLKSDGSVDSMQHVDLVI